MEIKLDHLLPEAREIALLPAEQRIAQLRCHSSKWSSAILDKTLLK